MTPASHRLAPDPVAPAVEAVVEARALGDVLAPGLAVCKVCARVEVALIPAPATRFDGGRRQK